ncbi:MAG: TraR/DksA C4-type zinc finger protein [Myxococcaceae bacterium]
MTPAQRKQFQQQLVEALRELSGKGPVRVDPNRTSEAEVGGDEDEQPLNEMLQSIASSRNRNQAVVIAKLEKALRKLRDEPDEFGVCEQCGEDILLGRLKAMPWAELCTTCQSGHDSPKGRPTRKKLTDYR